MSTHALKTWPIYFQPLYDGKKTFEVRKNDRGFKVGDTLNLLEWDPEMERYTMRSCLARVLYIMDASDELGYVSRGHVIMAIRLIAKSPVQLNRTLDK